MIMTCENAEVVVFIRGAKPPTKLYIPSTINIQMNLALLLSLIGLGCHGSIEKLYGGGTVD